MTRKVLVLEDESSIRSFIVINLRRAGYDVIEAETGEEALEKLKETIVLREAYPELSLSELAAEFDPPISKSCLNHRLRKLIELSRE